MIIKRLPFVLLCLIKALETAPSSSSDSKVSVDEATADALAPSIPSLNHQLSRITLESGSMEPSRPSLSPFEISEQVSKLIETISNLDTKTAVEKIEVGLVQILNLGASLNDIAPTIGSLPIEAKELVSAAIEQGAYTLLKLLQKAYIWRDERQYHWFMALSYESPWYDEGMWKNPEPFSLDWEKNLWAVCEVENITLAAVLRGSIPQGSNLSKFDENFLKSCIECDSVKMFEFTKLDPVKLGEYLEFLTKNSATKLLQLYQNHTKLPNLHLEKYPFPSSLSPSVDGLKFLLENGYNFFPMKRLIREFCKEGRLDLLKYLRELNPVLVPDLEELKYAAQENFRDILDWGRQLDTLHTFSYDPVFKALLIKRHFDTLYWWIEVNNIIINKSGLSMIAEIGALEVLQWIDKKQPFEKDVQEATNSAACRQQLPVLKWFCEKYGAFPSARSLANANSEILDWMKSKSRALEGPQMMMSLKGINLKYEKLVWYGVGNLELLQWVFKNAPLSVFDSQKEELSKEIKSMEMMLWLYDSLGVCPSNMNWAYNAGDLEAIEWVAKNCNVYPTKENVNLAAEKGYFHIITWIHGNVHPKDPWHFYTNAAKSAISYGNLEIAEYLISNVFPEADIEVSASSSICRDKHLALLEWAQKRGFKINQPGEHIMAAAIGEDMQVLEWLYINLTTGEPNLSLEMRWNSLVLNDLHKSYGWLLEKYPNARLSYQLTNDAHRAYEHGSLGILKVLYKKDPSLIQSIPQRQLTMDKYHVHKWLATNGYSVEQI